MNTKALLFSLSELFLIGSLAASLIAFRRRPGEKNATISTASVRNEFSWFLLAATSALLNYWLLAGGGKPSAPKIIWAALIFVSLITIRNDSRSLNVHTFFVACSMALLCLFLWKAEKVPIVLLVFLLISISVAMYSVKNFQGTLIVEGILLTIAIYGVFYAT